MGIILQTAPNKDDIRDKEYTRNENDKRDKNISRKIKHNSKPKEQIIIAVDMVKGLFRQADSMFNKDKTLANTYVKMGLKIARKYKLKLPRDIKRRYCKHCHSFLRIGVNCRVRIGEKNVIYSCLECRNFMRFPHKKPSRTAEMPK